MACLSVRLLCVLYVLGVLTCLAFSRAWHASKNSLLDMLQKMACLACFKMAHLILLNCFFGVFDHGALVNFRS